MTKNKNKRSSPLDVPGVDTGITRNEILDSINDEKVRYDGDVYPRILSVNPIENYKLEIVFVNGVIKLYDFNKWLDKFPVLKNETIFKSVQVDAGGYGVYWTEEIDMSEYELWTNGGELPPAPG
jgi:hypothetical protein